MYNGFYEPGPPFDFLALNYYFSPVLIKTMREIYLSVKEPPHTEQTPRQKSVFWYGNTPDGKNIY